MLKNKPKIVVIVGSTASGKSVLGVQLAKILGGEIISADSRQVYRGLNLGTGKITKWEMRGIPHHLLDVASPKQRFTVTRYQKLADRAIKDILNREKLPIIVGGTGLYIDTLVTGVVLPQVKPNLKLRKQFDKLTAKHLFAMLQKLDSARAKTIDRYNKRRLVRALEIITVTGNPVPKIEASSKYQVLTLGIKISEKVLKKRIHIRLAKRLQQGMIEEVKNLHKQGVSWKRLDELGLEYRYVSRYLRELEFNPDAKIKKGRGSDHKRRRIEMIEKLEKEIWHYAKRQMTWFKRDKNIYWLETSNKAIEIAEQFLKKVSSIK